MIGAFIVSLSMRVSTNCVKDYGPSIRAFEGKKRDFAKALGYTIHMLCTSQWYGKTDYKKSLEVMAQAADSARIMGSSHIMGFEYDRVITVGLRAAHEAENIREDATPVIAVSRGGLATLHNEGQTVIYPVVAIKKHRIFAKEWVSLLTEITAETLSLCNIIVSSQKAGVFTEAGKIASIGINLKRGVSTHGIAVNISNCLDDFSKIIPCGVAGQRFDRVSNYADVTPDAFFAMWARGFEHRFAPYYEQTLTNTHATL